VAVFTAALDLALINIDTGFRKILVDFVDFVNFDF